MLTQHFDFRPRVASRTGRIRRQCLAGAPRPVQRRVLAPTWVPPNLAHWRKLYRVARSRTSESQAQGFEIRCRLPAPVLGQRHARSDREKTDCTAEARLIWD